MKSEDHKSEVLRHRILIGLAWVSLLAMVLLSPKLWIPLQREFPLVPAFGSIPLHLGSLLDGLLTGSMLLGLLTYLWRPEQRFWLIVFLSSATLLILEDIARFQPWIYVYSALLFVWAWETKEDTRLKLAWLVLGSLYFWSGFQKLNHAFTVEFLPWLMEVFGLDVFFMNHSNLGYAAGAFELCIGLGLLFRHTRKWAVGGALLTHGFILYATGPLGHSWNSVIWPWNLAMVGILVLLIRQPQSNLWDLLGKRSLLPLTLGLVVLLWLLPVLNYFRLWDSHLSGSLYSGNNSEAVFYFHENDRSNMPGSAQNFMFFQESTNQEEFILLDHWALDELNAPFYPEARYFKWLGKEMCGCVEDPSLAGLKIVQKAKFNSAQSLLTYPCSVLLR